MLKWRSKRFIGAGRVVGRRDGFTLVELLVVIGIIGLLISILLPTLNQARRRAKMVGCLSNLRQLHLGSTMYANDNDGAFPYRGRGAPQPPQALAHVWVVPEAERHEEFPTPWDMRGYWQSYLGEYEIDDPSGAFYCPSVDDPEFLLAQGRSWPGFELASGYYLISYSYFGNYDWEELKKPPLPGNPGSPMDPSLTWDNYRPNPSDPESRDIRPVPRKLSDNATLTLFSDCLEDKRAGPPPFNGWWYLNHTEVGAIQFTPRNPPIPPEGVQAVRLEGSARFYHHNDDPEESELEPIITAIFSRPGFYWPKPEID